MARDPSELSAYLDGELSSEASERMKAWMREDPETAQEFKQLERSSTMLAQCIDRPQFHAGLMRRAQVAESGMPKRRVAVRGLLAAAAVLLVIAVGLLVLVQWRGGNVAAPGMTGSESLAGPTRPTAPLSSEAGPKLAAAAPAETTASQEPLAATKLNLELMGTITGDNPMAVIAVNEGPKQGPQVFQKGEAVLDGVTVVEISQDQVVLDNHGQQAILTHEEEKVSESLPDLSGLWTAMLIVGEQSREAGKVRIEQSGSILKVYDTAPSGTAVPGQNGALLLAEGRLSGRNAQVTLKQPPYNALGTLYGTINPDGTQFLAPLGRLSQQAIEVLGLEQEQQVPDNLAMKLVRVKGPDADAKRFQEARLQEVKAMADALGRFAMNHDGQYPKALAELVPGCVSDLSIFADTDTRKVQYIPGAVSPKVKPITTSELMKLDTSLPYPDALMKCEQALRDAGYAKFVFGQLILKVTYTNPDAIFVGDNRAAAYPLEPRADLADASTLGGIRASCQNNLKQMGLVMKMFENENREYTPPGWLYVFPEYITDPGILTSPKDQPGTDSYLYFCPATNIKEYISQVHGELDPGAFGKVYSEIPVMMNRTDFPNPAGRNVLFADGHVEFVRSPQIQPLLDFWSQRQ